MRRRELLALLGGAAVLPLRAQPQTTGPRRLGALTVTASDDAIGRRGSAILVDALAARGPPPRGGGLQSRHRAVSPA
jgi:hypothetical protein